MTRDPEPSPPSFVELLEGLEDVLRFERSSGTRAVEADPELVKGLAAFRPAEQPSPPSDPPPAPASAVRVPAPASPPAPDPAQADGLGAVAGRIASCKLCPLCETRTNTVPGQGPPHPEIAFVGEGPGADEDRAGLAFVGRAGQLLTKIIEAMGYTREEVWIGNIVKCRPPGNRTPMPDEMAACLPYLKEQLALLQPKVIVCLGSTAVKGLLGTTTGITRLRGTWQTFEGLRVMPTFHPAYLLRTPSGKREVWEDMKTVLGELGRPVPATKRSSA